MLRIMLVYASILFGTLAVCEVVLRVLDPTVLMMKETERTAVYQYDAELGWFPQPDSKGEFTLGNKPIATRHDHLGFRGPDFVKDNRPTVLFVGDSFVRGYDAEEDERFTELLQQKLPGLNIVNAGISGYGTDQEYLLLRRFWNIIRPNVVVLIVCTDNDHFDNSTNNRDAGFFKPYYEANKSGGEFKGIPVPKTKYYWFHEMWIAKHVKLVRLAIALYVYLRYPIIFVPDPTLTLIGMMKEFIETNGARFAVGMENHDAAIEPFLRERGVPYVTFDGAEHYHRQGSHWTPKGNALVADRLMTLFTEPGILPIADGPAVRRRVASPP